MDIPDEKSCTCCGVMKPLHDFYRAASTTDGRQARCKECHLENARAYRRKLRAKNEAHPPDPDRQKRCPACEQIKPGREFHRNRSSKDGRHWVCKQCNGSGPYRREDEQRRRFRRYDITPEQVTALLAVQQGACAICRVAFQGTEFNIDHCHTTGQIRGLLCAKCNTGVGLLGDEAVRLRAAVAYLEHPPMHAISGS